MDGAKILIVDDSRGIRRLYKGILEKTGYEVVEASDGVEALEFLREQSDIALVLLDLVMPNMNGIQTLENMRGEGINTPVIVITSVTQSSQIAECMKSGVEELIVKPTDEGSLVAKIRYVLGDEEPGEDGGQTVMHALLYDPTGRATSEFSKFPVKHVKLETLTSLAGFGELSTVSKFDVIIVCGAPQGSALESILEMLRESQPTAGIFALYPRTQKNCGEQALTDGYDGYLLQPLSKRQITTLFSQDKSELNFLNIEDYVLHIRPPTPGVAIRDCYFVKVQEAVNQAMTTLANAFFEEVIVDIYKAPVSEFLAECLTDWGNSAESLSLDSYLIINSKKGDLLKSTGCMTASATFNKEHIFSSVEDAILSIDAKYAAEQGNKG